MRRVGFSLLFAVCVSTVALAGTKDVQKEIERQYKRWSKAYVVNDVDTILSILTSDYTLTTYSGDVVSFKQYASSLREKKAKGTKNAAYTTKIVSLAVKGIRANVVSEEESVTSVKDPVTAKLKRLIHIHRYSDSWVKSGGVWKLSSTKTTLEKTTVGK